MGSTSPPGDDGGSLDRASKSPHQLDVYAKTFIPEYLRVVANRHAGAIRRTLPVQTAFSVNYEEYISSFAGTRFLDPRRRPELHGNFILPSSETLATENVSADGYAIWFEYWLTQEFLASATRQDECTLYRIPIQFQRQMRQDPTIHAVQYAAQVVVPGLSENSPMVVTGDTVTVLPLSLDPQQRPLQSLFLYDETGYPVEVPLMHLGWAGDAFDGEVYNVNRAKETIEIRISRPQMVTDERIWQRLEFGFANVIFPVRTTWMACLHRAVFKASVHLASDLRDEQRAEINGFDDELTSTVTAPESWIKRMLFPAERHAALQTKLNSMIFNFKAVDALLNYEQLRAIDAILKQEYGTVPYLIQGPPGTGKTKTLVEIALQLLGQGIEHILICAPSDPAADTLALRLSKHLTPKDMLRLNPPSRSFAEVPDTIMAFTHSAERPLATGLSTNQFQIPEFENILRYKVVVTTCRDADLLVRACLTNEDLFNVESKMMTAFTGGKFDHLPAKLHWQALLIDEAAQAIEPEALIPMTVVATPPSAGSRYQSPILVMAGDQKQLGPRTALQDPAIQTSMFERLLNRPLYASHPLARHNLKPGKFAVKPLTSAMLPIIRPPFTNLIRNYRSHPAILAVPNALFYHDTLQPEADNIGALILAPLWPGKWPVLFLQNNGSDEVEREAGGWYNISESSLALQTAQKLLASGLIAQRDICVMSPFSAQVRRLRIAFRFNGLYDVNIGPMEAFQGLESRAVILCTTRSRTKFLDQDQARGFGIINEPKRSNVAVTRAMQGLVVIGNAEVLGTDPCWRAFLHFCYRNGLHPPEFKPSQEDTKAAYAAPIPGLEQYLKRRAEKPDETHELAMAGAMEDDMWALGIGDALPEDEDEVEDDDDDDSEEQDGPHELA